jgi:hypothetical protein
MLIGTGDFPRAANSGMQNAKAIGDLYRCAIHCRTCFAEQTKLRGAIIDVAQPRWIGNRYFHAKPRIVFVMLNPGAGDQSKEAGNRAAREVLLMFRDGRATFLEVLAFQCQHMESWGKPAGRFLRFYVNDLGLELEELAFLNLALCATEGNRYPHWMLDRCFTDHSGPILGKLNPDLVVLCGASARRFAPQIGSLSPSARVVPMLHHSHRKGRSAEVREQARLREVICALTHGGV